MLVYKDLFSGMCVGVIAIRRVGVEHFTVNFFLHFVSLSLTLFFFVNAIFSPVFWNDDPGFVLHVSGLGK